MYNDTTGFNWLTVHRATQNPQTLGIEDTLSWEEVLPGFTLPIRTLFAALEGEEA